MKRIALKRKKSPAVLATSAAAADDDDATPDHARDIYNLIYRHQWSEVIDRVQKNPQCVGIKAPYLFGGGGYLTVLHALFMNHLVAPNCDDLIPVIQAILAAADAIDYTPEGQLQNNDGEDFQEVQVEGNVNLGSWRILLDNNNIEKVSPLHALCIENVSGNRVSVIKALLQLNNDDDDLSIECNDDYDDDVNSDGDDEDMFNIVMNQYQERILTLRDGHGRNILHILLSDIYSSLTVDNFDVVLFIIQLAPSLLFQRDEDVRKYPMEYVLEQNRLQCDGIIEGVTRDCILRSYLMLRFVVQIMERHLRWENYESGKGRNSLLYSDEDFEIEPRNVLQAACLLPESICDPFGQLIIHLAGDDVGGLEAELRDGEESFINMAAEKDENGNLALHYLLSNQTYSSGTRKIPRENDHVIPLHVVDSSIVQLLFFAYPPAILLPNRYNLLPLQIALQAGRRRVLDFLLRFNPDAALRDDSFDDIKVFIHLLGVISIANEESLSNATGFSTMLRLVRARPDIVSHAIPL